jgi:Ohr subfamily peroxiredoxin
MAPDRILYETEVVASGGREGSAKSRDGQFSVSLSVPRELGGPGGTGTNPEQLFAAGYAACFLGAVKLVARTQKIALAGEPTVAARVGIGPSDPGYGLAVELGVSIPGIDRALAERIVADAHQRCPYSKATRSNVDVKLTVL